MRAAPIQSHIRHEVETTVIQLTRLRHGDTFYLNPDLFERVDTHVDTVVRLTDGTEYLVSEPAELIIQRITEYRARIVAIAALLQANAVDDRLRADDFSSGDAQVPPGELLSANGQATGEAS